MIKFFTHIKCKQGFSLLEVMLSVAILTVTSFMIMSGFVSAMNMSHNTSVYNKVSGINYQYAIGELASYNSMTFSSDVRASSQRYAALAADGGSVATISFETNVGGYGTIDFKAKEFEKNYNFGLSQYSRVQPSGTLQANVAVLDPYSYSESTDLVTNRETFYYMLPYGECNLCGNSGYARYGYLGKPSNPKNWFCTHPDCCINSETGEREGYFCFGTGSVVYTSADLH